MKMSWECLHIVSQITTDDQGEHLETDGTNWLDEGGSHGLV